MGEFLDASRPTSETGRQYHINCDNGDLAKYVLMPGDPFRVPIIGKCWDSYQEVAHHREYRSAKGTYQGVELSACSTGIGGPSTEIAINELAQIGCDTMIRVGTTGGLREDIKCGDMIISSGAVRMDGSSDHYIWPSYPALANYEVIMALIEACEVLGYTYHVGVSVSVSSFYAGQARPSFGDYFTSQKDHMIRDLVSAGATNMEMESGTLFTLAGLFGLRAGMVCAANANRITNEWRVADNEERVSRVGAEAVRILAGWDAKKAKAGKKYLSPSLFK
jgi:uridine phosphorylase